MLKLTQRLPIKQWLWATAWIASLAISGWWIYRLWTAPIVAQEIRFPLLLGLVGVQLVLALWFLPKIQVRHLRALKGRERFDAENEARKTLGQILFGLGILVTFYSSTESLRVAQQGQITERFTKAVGQLGESGAERNATRLGGIYALERISRESLEDHVPIMEILSSYLRTNSVDSRRLASGSVNCSKIAITSGVDAPNAEFEAVLTVFRRRTAQRVLQEREAGFTLNLAGVNLTRASLYGAPLQGANLNATKLSGGNLSHADLSSANLLNTYFEGTNLDDAVLTGAWAPWVNFGSWNDPLARCQGRETRTSMRRANFSGAYLAAAQFSDVNLEGSKFGNANLLNARFYRANLKGADLRGALNMEWAQLEAACIDAETKLPPAFEQERTRRKKGGEKVGASRRCD
jgi:uncharacterized protein YjbI with pentapeptide repeats